MQNSVAHRIYELTEEALALENASLRDDVESYATLAKVALQHVAKLTTRNDALRQENRDLRTELADLRAELRHLRAFLMDQDRAA